MKAHTIFKTFAALMIAMLVVSGLPARESLAKPAEAPLTATLCPPTETTPLNLHYDVAPVGGPSGVPDVLFSFDSTGSMGGVIDSAKSGANEIMTRVFADIPGSQFGVVDFRDDGDAGPGPYQLKQSITLNQAAVTAAINTVNAGGGGDFSEAYAWALYNSYTDGATGWVGGHQKFVVMFGDTTPHDPDPHTGKSFATILSEMNANGVTLLFVASGSLSQWEGWAPQTGPKGKAIAYNASTFVDDIVALIEGAAGRKLEVVANPSSYSSWITGSPQSYIVPSGGGSYDFNLQVGPPAGTPQGVHYTFDIETKLDGTVIDTQNVDILAQCLSISDINPKSGTTLGGTSVTITGTGFTGFTSVTFGGTAATCPGPNTATSLVCTTPAHLPGAVPVVVTVGGSTATYNSYTYVCPAPTITSVSPNADDDAGGNLVTITGTNFDNPGCTATKVEFDSFADAPGPKVTGILTNDGTHITVIAPSKPDAPSTERQVDVLVYTPGGTADLPLSYVYAPAPTVTDVDTPAYTAATDYDNNAGPLGGNQWVKIIGTNFKSTYPTGANWTTTNVMFGGDNSKFGTCTVDSATQLTCQTPADPYHAAAPYVLDVRVVTPGGDAGIFNDLYLYVPPPTITHLSLDVGPTTGGSPVVLTGTNFRGGPLGAHGLTWTTDALKFGGTDAAFYNPLSPTQIDSTTPPHVAGQVDVAATTPGGTATNLVGSPTVGAFNYVQQSYFAVEPNFGPTAGGTVVTITGEDINTVTGVQFGGTAAVCNPPTATQIVCTTPAHAAGLVEVALNRGGTWTHYPESFTFVPPAVAGVAPNSGPTTGGTTVTITGTNFTGATAVTFDGIAAASFHIDGPTQITAVTPPHDAGLVNVNVTGGTPAAFPNSFTFVPPSSYADVYPNYGPIAGGTRVYIHGTCFTGVTAVTFGGVASPDISAVFSNTDMMVYTPAHAAGTVDIVVTTPCGPITYFGSFAFVGTDLPQAPFSVPANGAEMTGDGPNQLQVTFNMDVMHGGNADPNWAFSALNPANYLLVEAGNNGDFDTLTCWGGVEIDDRNIPINSVASYNAATFTATLNVNNGNNLPVGYYRLFACGTTSIKNANGVKLNGGLDDTRYTFNIVPPKLPETGFAPGMMIVLPAQPAEKAYSALGDLWLEIPRLGVQIPIVGIPASTDGWDVSWLGSDAGWLAGTAFPTWAGNSVLTAHVVDVNGNDGPFAHLNWLWYGDQIIVHAFGQRYIYEVRAVKLVSPSNSYWLTKHEDLPWLTLVTCKDYDAATNTYKYRVIIRAVQVAIQ